MFKWLITIAIVYLVYRWYRWDSNSNLIDHQERRELKDEEYTDYEEVE